MLATVFINSLMYAACAGSVHDAAVCVHANAQRKICVLAIRRGGGVVAGLISKRAIYIHTLKSKTSLNRQTPGPTLYGPFMEVVGLCSYNNSMG